MQTTKSSSKSCCTVFFILSWAMLQIVQAHNITPIADYDIPTREDYNYHNSSKNYNNDDNTNYNSYNINNNSNSEAEYFFESDIKITTLVIHRLSTTKFSQKSRNVCPVSRHLLFQVRLPQESYVTDFKLLFGRRTHKSRLVDRLTTKNFKASSVSHVTRSRVKGCDEFNFRLKVPPGEQVEVTLTYENLLERSEGRYEVTPYRDLCRHEDDRKYAFEEESTSHRHHHGNHHYRHNKIDRFGVDVVVKETSNVNKLMTQPRDTSSATVQSIIAGLSDMIPRSASVGDDSGKIPVILKRRLPDEVHYQFLYKEKYQEFYDGHSSSSSSSSASSSSSTKPLNWFIPREIKVSYDVQRDNLGEVQTRGSHFAYFFAPTHDRFNQLDKDVVFLVDASSDEVRDVHDALKKVLHSELTARDKFNILHFVPAVADEGQSPDDSSNPGRTIRRVVIGMAAGSEKNTKTASELLDDLTLSKPSSGTHKHLRDSYYSEMREGILQSLELLNKQKESDPYNTRLCLLFYITSMDANMFHLSKIEQEKILLSVEKGNRANSIIVPIILARGQTAASESIFGHLHFLDVLARLSNGSSFVHDQSTDFEDFFLRVFESSSKVLLKDLTLKALNEKSSYGKGASGQNESFTLQITSSHYPYFKEGDEIIAAGHLHSTLHDARRLKVNPGQRGFERHKKANFKLSVSGIGNNGFVSFDVDITFRRSRSGLHSYEDVDEEFNDDDLEKLRNRLKKFNHLERIKTHLQLKQLQEMLFLKNGRSGEEAKRLQIAYRETATQQNLLTTGKCLLMDKNLGKDSAICEIEETDLSSHGVKSMLTNEPLKSFADNDPHFVVRVDGLTEHVCFDVLGRAGKILQLLHDRGKGVTVNSLIVEPRNSSDENNHTYIGKVSFITSEARCLIVDTRWINFNGTRHAWNSNVTIELWGNSNTKVTLSSRRLVRIEHQDLTFRVMKHHVEAPPGERFNYLGFYIENEDHLSRRASGLIGQFSQMMGHVEGSSLKVKQTSSEDSTISLRSRLTFKTDSSEDRSAIAHLAYRRDMETRARTPCWHVGDEGREVAGRVDRFLVPTLCHRGPASRPTG